MEAKDLVLPNHAVEYRVLLLQLSVCTSEPIFDQVPGNMYAR